MKAVRVFLCFILWNQISSQQMHIFQLLFIYLFCGFEDFYASLKSVSICMNVQKIKINKYNKKRMAIHNIQKPLVEMIAAN